MRLRIAFAAAAASAAALATASPVTAAAASTSVPHRCHVSDLAARFHGSQVGLGNRGFLLTLTDVSRASCRLYGYPGLEWRDAARRALPTTTRRGPTYFSPDSGRKIIVLSPGQTASADIAFGVAGQPSNSVLATFLEITPPGGHGHFVLRIPNGAALVYRGQVDVTAMARYHP